MSAQFINPPVCLLKDFMSSPKTSLDNMLDFCTYEFMEKGFLELDSFGQYISGERYNEKEFAKVAIKIFNIHKGIGKNTFQNGEELYNSIETGQPRFGLNLDIWWDYYKKPKTEFQNVLFLAFCGLRSIMGTKPYAKINTAFWLSRMAGERNKVSFEELPPIIQKYSTEHYGRKIKLNLVDWGLKYPDIRCRGAFYGSFSLSLTQLTEAVLNKTTKAKQRRQKRDRHQALKAAKEKLGIK